MISSELEQKLTETRHLLHKNPELSEQEHETQSRILDFLTPLNTEELSKVGKTGVLAVFNGKSPGKSILIRGDIDALPIKEVNTFEHRSLTSNISHKCGHDGHTTILLGLATVLSETPINSGKIILLFQPAEENGVGAQAVINDPVFQKHSIDFVFALHNLPGYPLHEIVIKENEFTANVKSIIIKLEGKTAHAAEPEKGINPSLAIADLLLFAKQITKNDPSAKDFFLITPIHVEMGEIAYGISAGDAELRFTIRSWSTDLMDEKSAELTDYIKHISKKRQLNHRIEWTEVFHANNNHPEAVHVIRAAANKSNLSLSIRDFPFKWGEDFGLFTQKYKGAMFGIGSGKNSPALHNPDYDYPDEITKTGITIFHQIINQIV